MKDSDKKQKRYKDDRSTETMRNELQHWNNYLVQHHIDILLSDDQIENLYQYDDEEDLEASFYEDNDLPKFVEFERVRLYRVFNNGSFEEGGRLYGGWWQQIPSKKRQFITINERATSEYDYSSLHPAMLYADAGLPLAGDAYDIDGIEPIKYRKLIKTTFMKLINAQKKQRIDRPKESSLPPGWTWKQLQEAIEEKHNLIAKHFRSGDGLRLQKRDSDIALTVMKRMMARDILVLPVHDSFITYHELRNDLKAEMLRAYREHMNSDIGIKADTALVDRFIEELDGSKLSPEEVIDHHQDQPGYDGYRDRHREFFKSHSLDWDQRIG